MAKLTTKQRNALPDSAFALPSQRKYPIMDESHRKNAKARASQQEHKGNISKSTEEKIFKKANAKMKHHGYEKDHHGHDGHTATDGMAHMGMPHMHPQGHHKVGKHGGMIGQHPHKGTMSGLHSFHNIMHKDHHSKMHEG